ncbi:hypothetical protein J31TS4_08510 [Paenibacillus sp. J31TS4]|uniref:helix-turn-helix transcriptional regulator n=1 Tax=Paenibacillus sp. J31TS4 TaxID=2807195 RepID=UPI001B28078D|nr:AraC family transcriptional regulator [Paenibacillus sp. J31TS4]GIP37571.1 hypothetical protein J31TS4_08510 [Paenibacillus sp. J31TS4]
MKGFSIERVARKSPFTMAMHHFHDYYEIYYLAAGERHYFIKDRTYPVQAGGLVFIDKYDLHKTADSGPVTDHERILVHFDDEFLEGFRDPSLLSPFRSATKRIQLTAEGQRRTEAILQAMLEEQRSRGADSDTYLRALLAQLLILSGRAMQPDQEEEVSYASPLHKKIYEIVAYLNEHYRSPVTLTELAETHFISPYYLSRTFKQVTGFSFVEYLNSVRIKEAQRLLLDTDERITAIAEEVGFESIAHFGRVFKQLLQQTPMAYRKTARSGQPSIGE